MLEDHVQEPSLEEAVLAAIAPELAPHVHTFLHGGGPMTLPAATSHVDASAKVRELHDALTEAVYRRHAAKIAVLATALRLQSTILYEILKREFHI